MREDILKNLNQLTETERVAHSKIFAYSLRPADKKKRRIVERRAISENIVEDKVTPIFLRAHPRFTLTPEHTHDYIEIMYVCSGKIRHKIANREICVEAGELILLGRNTKHAILESNSNDIGINVIISTDLFETMLNTIRRDSSFNTKHLMSFLDKDTNKYKVFHCAQSLEISNLLEAMIYSSFFKDTCDEYILEQTVRVLLCYLCNDTDAPDDIEAVAYTDRLKKRIVNYIRTSYSTATLTECAATLGLSSTYLSRWIHRSFGSSFKELLMAERFSIACDLLQSTDMPIGDIIVHIGYENSSYFHKEFKRRYSMTPKEYRKTNISP